eukprot:g7893.t1
MADGTSSISRNELLTWINTTLGLNLSKIEQTASGAVACQLMDVLYNGAFPMQKIDFNAHNEYDMINNYKVLQAFFDKQGIEKSIEVDKLVKGRPLDNMEFIKWLKAFWDKESSDFVPDEDYNLVDRRQVGKTGDMKETGTTNSSQTAPKTSAAATTNANELRQRASNIPSETKPSPTGSSRAVKRRPPVNSPPVLTSSTNASHRTYGTGRSYANTSDRRITVRKTEVNKELTEMRTTAEESVKERDFFYSKLREIEILCQSTVICDIPIIQTIEQILYAPNKEEAKAVVTKCQMDHGSTIFDEAENGDDYNDDP